MTNILESISDLFIALDQEWRFIYLNRHMEPFLRRLSRTRQELIGKNIWEEFPDFVDSIFSERIRQAAAEQITVEFEAFYAPFNVWLEVRAYPSGEGLSLYFRDIIERKQAEAQLQTSLGEKEVLLKEIHHRVKNNLQIISSLLSLQADAIQDPHLLSLFQDSQHRVYAMALIHEQLYQAGNLSRITFADYIRRLATQVVDSYHSQAQHITLLPELAEVALAIDQAIPCGLILNELITNSLKYAFPDERTGEIRIDLHPQADQSVQLRVGDTGVGFPPDPDFRNTTSLGLQLVCTLAEQLHGNIELDRTHGTAFTLTFPAAAAESKGTYKDEGTAPPG